MWLMTPHGFFSIVCKPEDKATGTLTIRSRVQSDLESLRQFLPSLGPVLEGAGTDYRYRAHADREDVAQAVSQMVRELQYANFKSEVARRQGYDRAHVYGEVWNALYSLQAEGPDAVLSPAYGGVLVDNRGRILLRRPKNNFDGYVWTFPKGRPEPWDSPEETALREVKEETGYSAKIQSKLPGQFKGGTTISEFFLMAPIGTPSPFDELETSEIKWVTLDQAKAHINLTTNDIGRLRDQAVLEAVRACLAA